MKIENCYTCKIEFGMPDSFYDTMMRLKEKGSFFCPAGHSQHYVTGEHPQEKLRRERDRAVQEKARLAEELAAEQKKRQRLIRRTNAGVCHCCNRTFTNMARHMKTKHPEIVAPNVVKLKKTGA